MASAGVEDRLYQTIAVVLGTDPETLSEESAPETLDSWDSLNHLNLVMALESEYEISLSPEDTWLEILELTSSGNPRLIALR